jgi:hypothetical protein
MDIRAILSLKYSGTQWSLVGYDYAGLTWLSDSPKPTEDELAALWPEVQYETAYATVEATRQAEYQRTADPLYFKWQAGSGTQEEWVAARQAVKDAHPYPEDGSTDETQ